ncbi:MAG: hypothetical protein ACYC1D_02045 [Acidimicrobiales bacterium]
MMAKLSAFGIEVELPAGFEGRIFRRAASAGASSYPVVHLATFALPADAADFGGGATVAMAPSDVFAVLFEYGPESRGRALFARSGRPTALTPDQFHPYVLRRGVANQSGTQWFFTEQGRPFTFYAVLGSHRMRASLVPHVNRLLGQITVHPRSASGPAG